MAETSDVCKHCLSFRLCFSFSKVNSVSTDTISRMSLSTTSDYHEVLINVYGVVIISLPTDVE